MENHLLLSDRLMLSRDDVDLLLLMMVNWKESKAKHFVSAKNSSKRTEKTLLLTKNIKISVNEYIPF